MTNRPPTTPTSIDLDAFVAADYTRVIAAVRRICGTGVDAEDAVQDALVKLIQRGEQEPPIDSIPAWVTVVASNSARSGLRRRGSEERALGRLGVAPEATESTSEGRIDIDRALGTLPERQRQIATLFYLLDLPVAAIATAMSISDGTVKTQLSRARSSLATAMGLDGGQTDE